MDLGSAKAFANYDVYSNELEILEGDTDSFTSTTNRIVITLIDDYSNEKTREGPARTIYSFFLHIIKEP